MEIRSIRGKFPNIWIIVNSGHEKIQTHPPCVSVCGSHSCVNLLRCYQSPCRPMKYTFSVTSYTEACERDGNMDTRKGKRRIFRFADKAELSSSSCIFLSLTMSSQIKALENHAMVGYWHSEVGVWGSACSGHMEITQRQVALSGKRKHSLLFSPHSN